MTTAPAASADTMRTLNLSLYCATGEPYGLSVNTGSGWYWPDGSSYVAGRVKYFTAGTSTINANGFCQDYSHNSYGGVFLIFDCSLSSLTYS